MTYEEIKRRLTSCESKLKGLQVPNNPAQKSKNYNVAVQKLEILKESLQKQLKEAEKTAFINGKPSEYKDEKELQKFKDNVDVKSIETAAGKKIKEQEGIEFSIDETKAIAKQVGKAVGMALNQVGDEIAHMKAKKVEPNSFEIYVEYKNESDDQFSFYVSGDTLHIVDFSFDKELVDVGVKPSGEAIVHVEHLANELVKHFKSLNETEVNEAPEGTYYIEVSVRDARKALAIIDDQPALKNAVEMNGSNVYYLTDEGLAYDLMMDFGAQGIEVVDTNIEDDMLQEKEVEAPEGGIDHGGDLDVGHQDDEPNMLLKDVYDIAQYAAKLHKALVKYDQFDGEVDFPQWWQKKIILARDYVSAAQHYLEAEEKQPALDQLALEENRVKVLKEDWGSSDHAHMMQQIHKAIGEPKTMPSPFDNSLEAAVADNVDFYWDDWEEYKQDPQELYTKAKRDYLRYFFKDTFNKMVQMFEPVSEEDGSLEEGIAKTQKAHGLIVAKMKELAKQYKAGDTSVVAQLKDLTAKKKQLEKQLEKDVAGKNRNQQLDTNIDEAEGKSLQDLEMGEKFTFNGKEYTFIELYPELEDAAKVVRPDGEKSVVSFGGGRVNTGKKADIGPDTFGQGKGHHIDEVASTCCGKCGRKHVKGTKCKTPYLKGKDHCRTR